MEPYRIVDIFRILIAALILLTTVHKSSQYSSGEDRSSGRYTREIRIKQGSLRGLVLEPSIIENLQNVDMYLGIPYAAPPIGTQRFMPPGSPPQWTGVKMADRFGPVCPQNLPDFNSEPGKTMSEGRYNSLKRLLPYLSNQSEDCLYLNIYTPAQGGGSRSSSKYSVIVFIHGESFEWNSGNPYDGSVLASYGHVILVTINFRLGILGFLKPGIGEHTVSNFGLLDQIAALQWVKENIGAFGGDPNSVTLMGHGTGAACANFLLVSPVSNGLFNRAILMSGTALSDWASTTNPIKFTIQVAEALNCPSNDALAGCLRRKRLSEIMKVRVQTPPFKTPFGPVVDGSVVPNEPSQTMGVYKDLFSRYELLYGVTEVESYHLLDAVSLHLGMLERERDKLLREYVQARYEFVPDLALAKTLYEYTHWRPVTSRPIAEQHRDSLLEILSDARVASPLVQMADFHSSANPKSYFYVFTHSTKHGDFAEANIGGSVQGEELPYVLGVPMDNGRFPQSFTTPEKLFSEAIMTYWTNFAKTGNPNAPRSLAYLSQGPRDSRQYDIGWPEYDTINQTYLSLGIPPKHGHQYRKQLMTFWNEDLPDQLKNPSNSNPRIINPPHLLDIDPRMEVSPPWNRPPPKSPQDRYENFAKPFLDPYRPTRRPTFGKVLHEESGGKAKGLMDGPSGTVHELSTVEPPVIQAGNSSMALTLVIIIGVCFLVVNLCAFAALYYQRDRLKIQERIMKRRIDETIRLEEEGTYAKRVKVDFKVADKECKDGDGIYEAVSKKTGEMSTENVANMKRWQRQGSTSTMDAHTKVREWIQHEIVQRCSPRFLRRTRQHLHQQKSERERQLGASTETGLSSSQRDAGATTPNSKTPTLSTLQRKVKKVSVAVDATPAARSASVQKQVPIELSKSLDALTNLTTAHRPILKRSNTTMDENLAKPESPKVLRRSTTSINLLPFAQKVDGDVEEEEEVLKISHGHSHSAPVPFTMPYLGELASDIAPGNSQSMKPHIVDIATVDGDANAYAKTPQKSMSTFPTQAPKKAATAKKDAAVGASYGGSDINVTSRDSNEAVNTASEDPVSNLQRRNFPKVLPDLPVEDLSGEAFTPQQAAMKRRSLPPSNILVNLLTPVPEADSSQPTTPTGGCYKKPPPPPPRVSSTLGRKPTNTTPILGGGRKAPVVITQGKNVGSQIQRQEPKIIIKATSTTPVTRNAKGQTKGTTTSAIPRVTANPEATATGKEKAAKKSSKKDSETSTDDDNSSNTGTIKRVVKVDKKN